MGRRASKTFGGTTTSFLYDGLKPVQELVGGTPSANLLTGLGIDQFFSRTEGVITSSLLTDALGSTIALGDSAGAIQTSYSYEPFGKATSSGAPNSSSYQFTGRENDGTGLQYSRARYYEPGFRRFASQARCCLGVGYNASAFTTCAEYLLMGDHDGSIELAFHDEAVARQARAPDCRRFAGCAGCPWPSKSPR